jgi:hypothetical protein
MKCSRHICNGFEKLWGKTVITEKLQTPFCMSCIAQQLATTVVALWTQLGEVSKQGNVLSEAAL